MATNIIVGTLRRKSGGLLAHQIVDTLPEIGKSSTIYLIRNGAQEGDDLYLEYIYVDGRYELLGTTSPSDNSILSAILANTNRLNDLEPKVESNTQRLDVLEGDIDTEGSVLNTADSIVDDAMEWETY